MYKPAIILTVFFTFLFFTGNAQRGAKHKKYSIPFHVTAYNNIAVAAVLNNEDTVTLMLHTAASDVTLTEEATAKLKTIQFRDTAGNVQSWGGNVNTSLFSNNNSLLIEKLKRDSITIWQDKNSGQETDGKFGLNVFENKVLEVNFDKNLLTVEAKLPHNISHYEKFKILSDNDEMFIKALCLAGKDTLENYFLIHSGYAGSILLDDGFVKKYMIGQQIKITGEKKLQDAFGNTLTVKKGLLPSLIIGSWKLDNAPVGFFEGTTEMQSISIIGGDILKRFNWIIDARREYIYLKPNAFFKAGFSNI